MTTAAIYDQVIALIQEQKGRDFQVSGDLSIQEDFFADSVEFMEFIIALEDAFGIEINDESAESFVSIDDLVAYISAQLKD